MKTLMTRMLVVLILIFISACSQKISESKVLETPNNPSDEIPKWVFNQKKNQAVGSALSTPYGFSHQKAEAVMMARAELASSMKSKVEQLVKNFYETYRVKNNTERTALTSTTTRLVTDMVLVNSYISDIWISETHEMFVLVTIGSNDFYGSLEKRLKSSSVSGFRELDKQLNKKLKSSSEEVLEKVY